MFQSKLALVVLTKDASLSDDAIQADARRSLSLSDDSTVFVVRHAANGLAQTLNAWLLQNADAADCLAVMDADLLYRASLGALRDHVLASDADVVCCCDPAPKKGSLNKRDKTLVRFLCASGVFWLFNENAVRRIRSADTTDSLCEVLSDRAISLSVIPGEVVGMEDCASATQRWLLRFRCFWTVRRMLSTVGALSLLLTVVFFIVLLCSLTVRHVWNAACLAGCLVSLHLFLLSLAALLILWYRKSAALEKTVHDHPYVEETREK